MAEDQAELNGRGLPALAKSGEFEELRGERIRCTCRGSTIARFYVGRDDATGEPAAWIWLPPYVTAGGAKVPPRATTIPLKAGERGSTFVAQCAKCRSTWLALPAGIPDAIAESPTVHVFISARDAPADAPWAAGDRQINGQLTGEQVRGVGPAVLVRLESVTWGTVASDTPSEDPC